MKRTADCLGGERESTEDSLLRFAGSIDFSLRSRFEGNLHSAPAGRRGGGVRDVWDRKRLVRRTVAMTGVWDDRWIPVGGIART